MNGLGLVSCGRSRLDWFGKEKKGFSMFTSQELESVKRVAGYELRVNSGVCSQYDSDDVVQETALAVLEGYSALTWKARNIARNLRSKAKNAKRFETAAGSARESVSYESPLQTMIGAEDAERLWAVVDSLPAFESAVIRARYEQGLTIDEVCEAVGWSRGKVTRALASALASLRDRL